MDNPIIAGLGLFAGIGGLELGCKLALGPTYRMVGAVERDAYAAAALLARMEDQTLDPAPIWCGDLEHADLGPFVDRVDIITAGFSCQPWSTAGKRLGVADERWVWPALADTIRDVRPEIVFLENVSGLLAGGLEHVLGDLATLGFDAEWGCLAAGQVGATHKRDRVFILAYTDSGRLEWLRRCCILRRGERDPDRRGPTVESVTPPGRDDQAGWERVLDQHAGLEPAIRRVASGAPGWLDAPGGAYQRDRVRCVGNSVAPMAAAAALTMLIERATQTERTPQ